MPRPSSEALCYAAVLLLLAGAQLMASFVLSPHEAGFGLDQLRHAGAPISIAILSAIAIVATSTPLRGRCATLARRLQNALYARPTRSLVLALLSFLPFFLLRTGFINPDGQHHPSKIMSDVPRRGAHMMHDELWELYLHSRFWYYTNTFFDWTVTYSYQVMSAAAGVVFVWLLLRHCRNVERAQALVLAALVLSGGYVQLFFGDVENYTLTAVWILGYFMAAHAHLLGRRSLSWPSVVLALAMTFHLQAGFLGPSLAYLHLRAIHNRDFAAVRMGSLLFVAVLAGTLLLFHYLGHSITLLPYCMGLRDGPSVWMSPGSVDYHLQQLSLLTLLSPCWVLLIPLLIFRRIRPEPVHIHLAVAVVCLLLYQGLWRARLGVYNDWNLYACVAIPMSLLVWQALLAARDLPARIPIAIGAFGICALHSYSWILGNHAL